MAAAVVDDQFAGSDSLGIEHHPADSRQQDMVDVRLAEIEAPAGAGSRAQPLEIVEQVRPFGTRAEPVCKSASYAPFEKRSYMRGAAIGVLVRRE